MSVIDNRLRELGIELPEAPKPVASYVPAVTVDNLVYTSGTGCRVAGKGLLYQGKVGKDVTVEQAREAARQSALNLLAQLKAHLGSLDRVKRIVKLLAFVNGTDDFGEQPLVVNGASDLLLEVFGDKGRHARSAIGTNSLPMNMPVEIEMIVEIEG